MAWTPLKTNYTNASWSGKKKFKQINNSDDTVSFEDMTDYTAKENSFFGATDANKMNTAINDIMNVPLYMDGAGAMNSTHTTTGAYIGSQMYKTGLSSTKSKIKTDFGSSHILTHRNIFNNAVENGHASASAWYDSQIELMTPNNVYGSSLFTPVSNGQTIMDNSRLDYLVFPLFVFNPTLTVADNSYWLRDVALVEQFCYVTNRGTVGTSRAGNSYGIRPSFCIG